MTPKLNNLSPCPLPLQGKGAKKKRRSKAPSQNLSLKEVVKESQREVKPLF
jgi:hypothetical protein